MPPEVVCCVPVGCTYLRGIVLASNLLKAAATGEVGPGVYLKISLSWRAKRAAGHAKPWVASQTPESTANLRVANNIMFSLYIGVCLLT